MRSRSTLASGSRPGCGLVWRCCGPGAAHGSLRRCRRESSLRRARHPRTWPVPRSPRRECRTCPTGVAAADWVDRPRPPRSPTPGDDELTPRRSCRSLRLRSPPPFPTTRTTPPVLRNRPWSSRTKQCPTAAVLIERGGDVHIEMGVDATRDLCSHGSCLLPASTDREDTRPAGTADKTTTSLYDRLLVSHSARPVGVGWAPRTGRQINLRTARQDQASARTFESDPTRAPTTQILVARSGAVTRGGARARGEPERRRSAQASVME